MINFFINLEYRSKEDVFIITIIPISLYKMT